MADPAHRSRPVLRHCRAAPVPAAAGSTRSNRVCRSAASSGADGRNCCPVRSRSRDRVLRTRSSTANFEASEEASISVPRPFFSEPGTVRKACLAENGQDRTLVCGVHPGKGLGAGQHQRVAYPNGSILGTGMHSAGAGQAFRLHERVPRYRHRPPLQSSPRAPPACALVAYSPFAR